MTFLLPASIKSNCQRDGQLSGEYCFFDGQVKQTKNYTTLTVSALHPLLRKQIPLASIKRKSEDSRNVDLFWKIFKEAYSKASSTVQKIESIGWCTNKAGANTNVLRQISSPNVMHKREKHSKKLDGPNGTVFINLANDLLSSGTPETYITHSWIFLISSAIKMS